MWTDRAGRLAPKVTAALALVALAAVAVGCGGATSAGATGSATKTGAGTVAKTATSGASSQLKLISYQEISTGNAKVPAFTTDGEDLDIEDQIYDSLLTYDPKTLKIKPDLATSYNVTGNGKTWTFHLRHGVKWQHGFGQFTCADVQFTWDFNKNPANHSFWQRSASVVDHVSCPDPYTAVIQLKAPFQGFIWNVENIQPNTGLILSKAAWDKLGKAGYNKEAVGTGPYMLKKIVPNQDVYLVRNPDYWGPKPWADELDFKVITDATTAALAVKTGALDIADVDALTATEYKNTPGVKIIPSPTLDISQLELNELVQPFNNALVRRAVRYAINYPGLVKTVLRGFGHAGYQGMILPQETGFDAAVNPENVYDPAKAKKLLRQAGVKLPIQGFFTTYNDTLAADTAQFVSASLKAAGIDLQGRPLERGTLVRERALATTPAVVLNSTLSPDPNFLLIRMVGLNAPPKGITFTRYEGINKLYEQQLNAPTVAARAALLKQIQEDVVRDAPTIELYTYDNIYMVNDHVQGYVPTPLYSGPFLDQVRVGGS